MHAVSSNTSCNKHAHTASRLLDPFPGKFAAKIFADSTQCLAYESPFFLRCPRCQDAAKASARFTSGSWKIAYRDTSTPCNVFPSKSRDSPTQDASALSARADAHPPLLLASSLASLPNTRPFHARSHINAVAPTHAEVTKLAKNASLNSPSSVAR